MGLGKKAAIFVVRPIYRKFFEPPLWWFLAKVKTFFFAEISEHVLAIENKLNKLDNIEERLRSTEAGNAAQWNAVEELLLAMFRQRESRISELDREGSALRHDAISEATEVNRINGPNAIR